MSHHTRDDWNWKRLDDGGVQVYNSRLGVQHKMSPGEWASVISSVSARGETSEQHHLAEAFHNVDVDQGAPVEAVDGDVTAVETPSKKVPVGDVEA